MRNIITIMRKELSSYFRSPVAYLLLFLFAAATGGVFYLYIKTFIFQSLTQAQYAQMYEQQMPPMNVNEMVAAAAAKSIDAFISVDQIGRAHV